MAFTYDDTQLATSALFRIRLAIGDTNSTDPLLQDGEIQHFIDLYGEARAGIESALAIAAKFSREASRTVGKMSTDLSKLADQYRNLAKQLQSQAGAAPKPYAGGIEISDVDAVETDQNRTQPAFTRGMHDNTRTSEDEDELKCPR